MAFGFVVVKFSLFAKQLAFLMGKDIVIQPRGYSSVIGIILVAVGSTVLVLSFIKYKQTERRLLEASYQSSSRLTLTLVITILVISVVLIFYLIENSINV